MTGLGFAVVLALVTEFLPFVMWNVRLSSPGYPGVGPDYCAA
jgi:hypothetical protein